MLMTSLQTRPYILDPEAEIARLPSGLQVSVKATTIQTGGSFTLLEVAAAPGTSTPVHIHYAEDVAVFVVEGSLRVFFGDREIDAEAGSYAFFPRGTPHGFRVRTGAPARALYLTVPGGFDRFIQDRGLWTEASEGVAVAARYGIEILGPLPE